MLMVLSAKAALALALALNANAPPEPAPAPDPQRGRATVTQSDPVCPDGKCVATQAPPAAQSVDVRWHATGGSQGLPLGYPFQRQASSYSGGNCSPGG